MGKITFMSLLQLAWKRLWALLLTAFLFATCALGYCYFFATPTYMATASVLVTNGAITSTDSRTGVESVSGTDISASLNLADTITDILKTPDIYKELAKKVSGNYNYETLMKQINILRRSDNSLFVDVKFRSSSASQAKLLADTFAELSCEYITDFIPYSNAKPIYAARSEKVSPQTVTATFAAAFLGVVVAFAIVFTIDMTDKAIKGEADFQNRFDIPLIGSIPDFEDVSLESYYSKGGYRSGY